MSKGPPVERTLVLLKPDAVGRGLVGEILARFERKGLDIVGLKLLELDRRTAEEHYAEHRGKPFYEGLVNFITAGPLAAAVLEGRGAVEVVRKMVGATSGQDAACGTIRGDYGLSDRFNLVHASDGPESARAEIARFFREDELVEPVGAPAGGRDGSPRAGEARGRPWTYDCSGGAPL